MRKKRPPFCKVKSWQKKRKRDRQLKMMDRIMRAWTAWIHSARRGGRSRRVLSITNPQSSLSKSQFICNIDFREGKGKGETNEKKQMPKCALSGFVSAEFKHPLEQEVMS